jgi:hypothetical protein
MLEISTRHVETSEIIQIHRVESTGEKEFVEAARSVGAQRRDRTQRG